MTIGAAIQAADRAMLEAKRQGRNRAVGADRVVSA